MQALKIATIVMGVLIVVGTIALVVGVARRASEPVAPLAAWPAGGTASSTSVSAILDEPEGTRIAGVAALRDRLAVQLEGGGADRVVLIDPVTGTVTGRISLAR